MAVDYTPRWREYAYQDPAPVTPSYQQPVPAGAPVLPMAPGYTIKAEALRTFDLRTAPDRLSAYCDALDRRVEVLETELAALRQRLHRLELVEVAE